MRLEKSPFLCSVGAFKMISHGLQRQKRSRAERQCVLSCFSLDCLQNRSRTSSQITRASLLCSSLGFSPEDVRRPPGCSFTHPNNRKREVESTNPRLKQGKGSSKPQPESEAILCYSLKIMLDQKEWQLLFLLQFRR